MSDEMKKVKVSELQGETLDLVVAQCEGFEIVNLKHGRAIFMDPTDDGALNEMPINYSTDWAQGGPIIEREGIGIVRLENDTNVWVGSMLEPDWKFNRTGPTPLVAAMRCYVASKLGDEVEVPDELA